MHEIINTFYDNDICRSNLEIVNQLLADLNSKYLFVCIQLCEDLFKRIKGLEGSPIEYNAEVWCHL